MRFKLKWFLFYLLLPDVGFSLLRFPFLAGNVFYSAPRAKRGGPNKLKRMALTTWDFTPTWVTKMAHFLQLLISQDRNNILEVFQSPKPSTHHVLLTCAIGTLQCGILHPPGSPKWRIFCNCSYLRLETTFSRSLKALNHLLIMCY